MSLLQTITQKKSSLAMGVWLVVFAGFLVYQLRHTPSPPTFLLKPTQTKFLANVATDSPISAVPSPKFLKSDVSRTDTSVHASTLAYLEFNDLKPKRQLMAAWFAGSREGAKDVQIFAAFLDLDQALTPLNNGQVVNPWTTPKVILSPDILAKKSNTHIKKLGNPVLYQSADGTVHLFVVATSYAGWAASKIYHLTSKTGDDFVFKQILPLSPFLNVSHLVRAVPVTLADGGFYLPVYHEMWHKFELILRFDKAGNIIQKIRPNALKKTLQPAMTALSADECLMVRRHRHTTPMMIQHCYQGGLRWDLPYASHIDNDNNSPNVVNFHHTPYLVHNQPKKDATRYYLWLSKLVQQTDSRWLVEKKVLLDTASDVLHEVSYPTTLVLGDEVHIVYTHDRARIFHVVLNQEMVDNSPACLPSINVPTKNASVLLTHADCRKISYAD